MAPSSARTTSSPSDRGEQFQRDGATQRLIGLLQPLNRIARLAEDTYRVDQRARNSI